MATITNSAVVLDEAQADGRRRVIYNWTFDTGEVWASTKKIEAGFDAVADVAALAPAQLEAFEVQVDGVMDSALGSGADPATTWNANPHTNQRKARYMIRRLLRSQSAVDLLAFASFFQWMETQFTATQIATALGVTGARWNNIREHILRVLSHRVDLETWRDRQDRDL